MSEFPAIKITEMIKSPEYNTVIVSYVGGKGEQRISAWPTPRYKFDIRWDVHETAAADTVLALFNAVRGAAGWFWFASLEEATRNAIWTASRAYVVGDIVRPTTKNGRSYICTVAGTSSTVEPAWTITRKGTQVDGTVTWRENSYKCRFATDMHDFRYFYYGLYDLGSVQIVEVL